MEGGAAGAGGSRELPSLPVCQICSLDLTNARTFFRVRRQGRPAGPPAAARPAQATCLCPHQLLRLLLRLLLLAAAARSLQPPTHCRAAPLRRGTAFVRCTPRRRSGS